jgi:polyhydroxyalkanoate synthesis regulator phasin
MLATQDSDEFYLFNKAELESMIENGRRTQKNTAKKNLPAWLKESAHKQAFTIPPPPNVRWVLPGEVVEIGKYKITAGFFYFGTLFLNQHGLSEPSLINADMPFPNKFKNSPHNSKAPDFLDYARLNPLQRREYLAWLSGGRSDPNANEWVVLLFICGLERRFIEDAERGIVSTEEKSEIRNEALRLLNIYGRRHNDAGQSIANFFKFTEFKLSDRKLYSFPAPAFPYGSSNEIYAIVTLNQIAKDDLVLDADIAFLWLTCSNALTKIIPLSLDYEDFKFLYKIRFDEKYKNKLKINLRKKELSITETYLPVSKLIDKQTLNIPDKLFDIDIDFKPFVYDLAIKVCAEFIRYTSAINNNKDISSKRKRFIKPFVFWDNKDKDTVAGIIQKLTKNVDCSSFFDAGWLTQQFDLNLKFSDDTFKDIIAGFEANKIGVEPDILANPFDTNEKTCFYMHTLSEQPPVERWNNSYECALLCAQLLTCALNEVIPNAERLYFPGIISIGKLDDYFCNRVSAAYIYMRAYPASFSDSVSKFKKYRKENKMVIIQYVSKTFDEYMKNGFQISYESTQFLEKLYKEFKINKKELYSNIHSSNQNSIHSSNQNKELVLDKKKINKLRKETEHVSKVLSNIFTDKEDAAVLEPKAKENNVKKHSKNIWGLDDAHSELLFLLITKEEWQKKDLIPIAKKLDLMLDGAIETINEKAFENFDEPLIEDDDSLLINKELVKMIKK